MKKKKLFSLVLATVLTAATVLPCYGASTKEKISNAQAEQAAERQPCCCRYHDDTGNDADMPAFSCCLFCLFLISGGFLCHC